jgi:hypothetical protein
MLRIRSGIWYFLAPGPGVRNKFIQIPDPTHISVSIATIFGFKKCLNSSRRTLESSSVRYLLKIVM